MDDQDQERFLHMLAEIERLKQALKVIEEFVDLAAKCAAAAYVKGSGQ